MEKRGGMIVHGIDLGFNSAGDSEKKTYTCPKCDWALTWHVLHGAMTFEQVTDALVFHSDRCTRVKSGAR
jgi:hypothetical protein